jgi:HPt (histidine-containing phosphotransfer) domain-containing protein
LRRWLPLRPTAPDGTADQAHTHPARVADARPLVQRLASLPGFDVPEALEHVGGREEALRRVLGLFVNAYHAGEPALLPPDGDDVDTVAHWRAACHSLRGACAAIGARSLLLQILSFEARLDSGAPAAALVGEGRALNEALIALAAALPSALGIDH